MSARTENSRRIDYTSRLTMEALPVLFDPKVWGHGRVRWQRAYQAIRARVPESRFLFIERRPFLP